MTQEEKQLLLKDLCDRLLYGVKCYGYQFKIDGNHCEVCGILTGIKDGFYYLSDRVSVNGGKTYDERYLEVKPYLRPISSMTEEEMEEYWDEVYVSPVIPSAPSNKAPFVGVIAFCSRMVIDWLNEHHFDYRGLIEKGLALEAPEGMYKNGIEYGHETN